MPSQSVAEELDDVTYVHDDVTYVHDDVTYVCLLSLSQKSFHSHTESIPISHGGGQVRAADILSI